MLEGKQLILATKPFAVENKLKSWFHILTTFSLLLLCYTLTIAIDIFALKIIFAILTSLVSLRMFIVYHDYLHKTILQDAPLANAIFTIFGLYILAPTSIWKRSHDYHHQHNSKLYSSSIGSFPIVTKEKYNSFTSGEKNIYRFIRHPFTILFGYIFAFMYGMCIQSLISSANKHWDSAVSLVFHFSVGFSIYYFFGIENFLIGFLLPSFISSAMGSYLFFAQHNFPGATFEEKEGWTYVNAAMQSSSYMTMSPIMHWFTGNIGYHHIHHLNARIPFYRLPETFNSLKELQQAKTTSLSPIDIIKCLRLAVWDPEQKRMITYKEI
jgi:acyl-lipid omega-6 desaturase (Delta-12 desaturase)